MTVREIPRVPRRKNNVIFWNAEDDEKERKMAENEKTSSMWAYDARRLPDEFVDLDQETFLTDQDF